MCLFLLDAQPIKKKPLCPAKDARRAQPYTMRGRGSFPRFALFSLFTRGGVSGRRLLLHNDNALLFRNLFSDFPFFRFRFRSRFRFRFPYRVCFRFLFRFWFRFRLCFRSRFCFRFRFRFRFRFVIVFVFVLVFVFGFVFVFVFVFDFNFVLSLPESARIP